MNEVTKPMPVTVRYEGRRCIAVELRKLSDVCPQHQSDVLWDFTDRTSRFRHTCRYYNQSLDQQQEHERLPECITDFGTGENPDE